MRPLSRATMRSLVISSSLSSSSPAKSSSALDPFGRFLGEAPPGTFDLFKLHVLTKETGAPRP